MITSKEDLIDGQELTADICIIGGGPAAISMALSFSSTKYKVILITGGGWAQTQANSNLYQGIITPVGSHEPIESTRRRQFGGGSAVWAGRCVPFDALDFEYRSWVKESGWPISYNQLLPYFKKACSICQIGDFDFNTASVFPDKQQEIIPGLDSAELESRHLERYSSPIHFAKDYKTQLESSLTVQVLLDAHVLELEMQNGANAISGVKIAAGDNRAKVLAKYFVMAAGGIENARLLLASANKHFPTGIGNQYDNVGRYYMTHITGTYAKLNPTDRDKVMFDFEKDKDGIFCRRRWGISETAQKNRKILNTIFYLSHPKSLTENRSLLFSVMYKAAKKVVLVTGVRDVLRKIVRNTDQPPTILKGLLQLGLPSLLPSKNSKYWGLFFQAEQVPNRESRITLSKTQKDALGMPRVEVHIAFKDIDTESLVKAHNLFVERYRASGAGEIIYTEDGLREYLKYKMSHFNSYAHHMGTTRMSDNPQTGVVDSDAKVFAIDNLFISGSSTFPTGGHANPTITVVAQALRLTDHLKKLLGSKYKNQAISNLPVSNLLLLTFFASIIFH